ncbi:MAG: hypothetical protein JAY68_06375 [Candidatus Thiodiazotropha taylori]|nr:hypothetical protein [Candidatus Thiodiazotropha taylori]
MRLFNAAEFHDAWFGALFAAAGALVINVLTSFSLGIQDSIGLLLGLVSLVCFSWLAKIKADAERQYVVNVEKRERSITSAQIHKAVYEKKQLTSNIAFVFGVLALLLACIPVVLSNKESAEFLKKMHTMSQNSEITATNVQEKIIKIEGLLNSFSIENQRVTIDIQDKSEKTNELLSQVIATVRKSYSETDRSQTQRDAVEDDSADPSE